MRMQFHSIETEPLKPAEPDREHIMRCNDIV